MFAQPVLLRPRTLHLPQRPAPRPLPVDDAIDSGALTNTQGLIQAGGAEMLAADAELLADRIRASGAHCELQIWPDQVHVFQALPKLSPEATPAIRAAAQFLCAALPTGTTKRATCGR